jgi:hypothetical protein
VGGRGKIIEFGLMEDQSLMVSPSETMRERGEDRSRKGKEGKRW